MIEISQIQEAVVSRLKEYEEKQISGRKKYEIDKANGTVDIVEQLCPPKIMSIDYDYVREIVADLLTSGIIVYPKTQEKATALASDIVSKLITYPLTYDEYIEIQRDSWKTTVLQDLHKKIMAGEKVPVPQYSLSFDMRDLAHHQKPLPELVRNATYRTEKGTLATALSECKWIKGKFKLDIEIPFARCDLNNLENDMENLIFELRKQLAWNYELGEVTVSFGQKKSEDWDVRYLHSEHTLAQMKELDELVSKHGGKLYFSELGNTTQNALAPQLRGMYDSAQTKWTFEQLATANSKIDELANIITENKLTPFEAIAYVSAWSLINLKYREDTDDTELTNTFVSAVVTKAIQCVGMTEFVNAVLSSVDFGQYLPYSDLEVRKISCTMQKNSDGVLVPDHSESHLYVVDPKYQISGGYICDMNMINMFDDLTEVINQHLATQSPEIQIKPFNSMFLRNISEYRTLFPEYTVFPYSSADGNDVLYVYKKGRTPYSAPVFECVEKVGNVSYNEYMDHSKQIMAEMKLEEGKPISTDSYCAACLKVLPLLYPEFRKPAQKTEQEQNQAKQNLNLLTGAIVIMNTCIDRYIKESSKNKGDGK